MGDVNMRAPDGTAYAVPAEKVRSLVDQGFTVEGGEQAAARGIADVKQDKYGGVGGAVVATGAGVARGITLGASDVALRGIYGDEGARDLTALKTENPGLSIAGEIGGALATGHLPTPAGLVGKLGTRIGTAAEGAGALTRIGRAGAGQAVEGGIYGLGSGVSELALSNEPLTVERAASVLSSNALYGGVIGGAAGTLAKTAEIGLQRAKGAIDGFVESRAAARAVPDDLAALDIKGLRGAQKVEEDAIKTAQKAETEAIATQRVTENQTLADEIGAFRREVREQKHFLTTKDVSLPAAEGKLSSAELGRVAGKADKQLANVLDNPIGLAKNPGKALDALQRQENGFVKILERDTDLRAAFAADTTGARAAALDSIPAALEKNRALQARIGELQAAPKLTTGNTSARLDAIEAAKDALAQGGPKSAAGKYAAGLPEHVLGGASFGAITALASPLGPLAPFVGALGSKLITEQVLGRFGKAAGEVATRSAKAVSSFLDTSGKAIRSATPIATKVLSRVRYAPSDKEEPKHTLASAFKARSEELRSQTAYGPTGQPVMRPEARQAVADRLKPFAVADPLLADRLESLAARRVEFLASKLPRRPDVAGIPLGPDRWQPSDLEMRKFARYAAAAEDPHGIVDRLVDGQITPEDGETMRALYPEMHADIVQQVVARVPELSKTLPYKRKLALSIFTSVPVDASMDPRVMAVLQGHFVNDAGDPTGEAPKASPAFGSVKADTATPAQERAS